MGSYRISLSSFSNPFFSYFKGVFSSIPKAVLSLSLSLSYILQCYSPQTCMGKHTNKIHTMADNRLTHSLYYFGLNSFWEAASIRILPKWNGHRKKTKRSSSQSNGLSLSLFIVFLRLFFVKFEGMEQKIGVWWRQNWRVVGHVSVTIGEIREKILFTTLLFHSSENRKRFLFSILKS